MKRRISRNRAGLTLVEVLIVIGIMGAGMLIFANFMSFQLKSTATTDYHAKVTQLRSVLIGQFLMDSNNCKCLFNGATPFPASGTAQLAGVAPTQVGRYSFVTPGDCTTATVPRPYVNNVGIDGMKTVDISLRNITNYSGVYAGDFVVDVEPVPQILGFKIQRISVPVVVNTVPAGANRAFDSCGISQGTSTGLLDFSDFVATGVFNWTALTLSNSGGSGATSGTPVYPLGSLGGFPCGPLTTVTLPAPVTPTTKAALVGFVNINPAGVEVSSAARIVDMSNRYVALIGQAGRGGDGRSWGSAGEVIVPLTSGQFRVQFCRRNGGASTFYYSVKGIIN